MVVKNEVLIELLKDAKENNQWDAFFTKTKDVIDFTFVTKFPNIKKYHYDVEGLKQECLLKIWNLIVRKQIRGDGNIFSYIIGAVSFIIRDEIRKSNRRKSKVTIVNLDNEILMNK